MRGPIRQLAVVLLPLLLTSCFTMTLWGFPLEDDISEVTGEHEFAHVYDEDTEWSWSLFGLRVVATPFTVLLDCLTFPVQAFLFYGDDDDC